MAELITSVDIQCPYCGERLDLMIDCTAGSQTYYEDCQVCCSPIEVSVTVDACGNLSRVTSKRDSD